MPHNPAIDALNEVVQQAQADGVPYSTLTIGNATQILSQPPALPAPAVSLKADQCDLLWRHQDDNGQYASVIIRNDGTVHCAVQATPGVGTSTRGDIYTGHPGWPLIIRSYIALAVQAGIISTETVRLSDAPDLLEFCRTVTAVGDLSRQLRIPGQRHWPAIEALLAAYWPDWDCPWIPDGITSSLESNLVINVMDPAEPEGRFPKHYLNTLLAACRLAGAESGEPAASLAETHTELQDWVVSSQPKSRHDLGSILHTAELMLGSLNSRSPAELSQPMPEREPSLTLEAFRQELTLAVLRTHQAGVRPIAPEPE